MSDLFMATSTDSSRPDHWPAKRVAQFWRLVSRASADACWPWTGCRLANRYGRYRYRDGSRQVSILAHRAAYILTKGVPPANREVFHLCGNDLCANPRHIGTRTPSERLVSVHRERVRPRKNSKLTRAQVAHLRALKRGRPELRARDIARRVGISVSRLNAIWRGEGWPEGGARPERCGARSEYTGVQCLRLAASGSRVCWQHQMKRPRS
jgi:hypothetical protein